jgi:predicted nucleotidyltransferase component of viral defense system
VAVLDRVLWETITDEMRRILHFIRQQPFADRFYLAGGTALALRFGHRRSVDLDFFSATDEVLHGSRREILNGLGPLLPQTLEATDGNLLLLIGGLHVGFFGYGYSLLEPSDTVDQVNVASLVDIGLMKLDALISRGSRKDFYDLYIIAQQIPIRRLLVLGRTKYPYARDFEVMAVESLALFDNADRDFQPELLIDLPWQTVRQFFTDQAKAFGVGWIDEK